MQDPFATIQRVLETDKLPGQAGELLGCEKRLGEKSFQQAGTNDHFPVFWRKLFQSEHGNNVLEVRILGEGPPDFLRKSVMSFADDTGRGHFGTGLQRINGREKSFT